MRTPATPWAAADRVRVTVSTAAAQPDPDDDPGGICPRPDQTVEEVGPLGDRERGGLAGGPEENDAITSVGQEPGDVGEETVGVGIEGGSDGCERSRPHARE